MIRVYLEVDGVWRRVQNSERFELVTEIGGRVPKFTFYLNDRDFRFSPFHDTEYSKYLHKQ